MFKKRFFKIIVLFLLMSFSFIGVTNSNYLDQETSGNNTFSAGSIDFSLRDTSDVLLSSPLFNISGMKPGDSETKTVRIKKMDLWILNIEFGSKRQAETMLYATLCR